MRSKLSGVQIPTAAKLNIDGEFTLDAAAGTSGQVLTSAGTGNTPTWTSPSSLVFTTGTLSLAGNVTHAGAFTQTFTATANTSLTLPTNGTLVNIPSSVSGAGTATSLTGGASTNTTGLSGGAVNITGGASTSGTSTNTGGAVNITGGASNTSAGIGGSVTINGGVGSSANGNGTVSIGTGSGTDQVFIGRAGTTTTVNGTLTADQVFASNNGNGTNFKVGDDVWLGDINVANTMSLKGQQSATSGYIRFGGDSNAFGYDGSKLSYPANLTTSGLTLSSITLPSAAAGAREYNGTAFYSTPNATTGRAVDVASYYYVSDGTYSVDHSVSATAKSIFGGASTGLTLIAGTTYEVELNVYTSVTVVGVASPTWSHSFLLTTVSGTPTTTIYQEISTSSNTTSFATASTVSRLRNINNATVSVLASVASGSRYSIYTVKGIIRVTGTGSVEISPAATASATSADYSFLAAAGSYIKITPIGNGTVTGVGAWA